MLYSFSIAFLVPAALAARSHRAWEVQWEAEPSGLPPLPCTMWLDVVETKDRKGEVVEGVKPIIECSADIADAVLKVPRWKKKNAWLDYSMGLLTKGVTPVGDIKPMIGPYVNDTMMDETYFLEGSFGEPAERGQVSAVVAPVAFDCADFPCKLLLEAVALSDSSPGFTLSLQCSKKVSNTVLRVPGGFADLYLGFVEAGGPRTLLLQRKETFAGKEFSFQGACNGTRGSYNITV
mmetsp:Transcript_29620/g.68889  ORF Transcript_29620/g.68889 Transcript_29620/m.68889 type:complete len:235 (+) Transcript_29620:76-780(+)